MSSGLGFLPIWALFSLYRLVTFLLAQKRGNKPEFVEPARVMAKKGTLPNASPRRAIAPRWAKRPSHFFTG